MKHLAVIALICASMALCGCSTEKAPEPPPKLPAITLSPADKELLRAFQKDILSDEKLADRAVKLAGDELKNVLTGGDVSLNLPTIVAKAKAECLLAAESLARKAVPEALSPEMKSLLNEGKSGLSAAYKAYAESFDSVRSFVADKNPMALFEYRKKYSQAQALSIEATDKIKQIMMAAGVAP